MFELSAKAPAFLGGGEPIYGEILGTYGYEIGMAFQMVDDILDFSSDSASMGKPVANDLRLGLITLPALYYLEAHPGEKRLATLQEGGNLPEEELQALIEDIRAGDAISLANAEARRQADNAVDGLDELPDTPERVALGDLAQYVVDRLN